MRITSDVPSKIGKLIRFIAVPVLKYSLEVLAKKWIFLKKGAIILLISMQLVDTNLICRLLFY